MAIKVTEHARKRCQERDIPDVVLERLLDGAFVAQALEDDGRISHFHIVRVARERYWVAVERDAVCVTVIPVGFIGSSARDWFSRRLLNFRHVIDAIEALPVTSTRRLRRAHDRELTARKSTPYREERRGLDGQAASESDGPRWGLVA